MAESSEVKKNTDEGKGPNSANKITLVLLAVILILLGILFRPQILAPFNQTAEEETPVETEVIDVEEPEEVEEVLGEEEEEVMPDVVVDTSSGGEEYVEPQADLYVKSYSYGSDLVQNDQFTMTLEIGNKGDANAGSFDWEWWATDGGKTWIMMYQALVLVTQ